MTDIIRAALEAAKATIQVDRTSLADTSMRHDNTMDPDGAQGVADYDEVLAKIEAGLVALPSSKQLRNALELADQLEQRFGNSVPTKQAAAALRVLASGATEAPNDGESEYQRGYRHGYNQRCAEVLGALT